MRIPPHHKIAVGFLFLILSAGIIQAQNQYLEINPSVWIIGSTDLAMVTAHIIYPYSDIDLDQIKLTLLDQNNNPIESELKYKSMDQAGNLLLSFIPDQTELVPDQTLTVQVDFDTLSQPVPNRPDLTHTTTVSVTEIKPPKTFFQLLLNWLSSII